MLLKCNSFHRKSSVPYFRYWRSFTSNITWRYFLHCVFWRFGTPISISHFPFWRIIQHFYLDYSPNFFPKFMLFFYREREGIRAITSLDSPPLKIFFTVFSLLNVIPFLPRDETKNKSKLKLIDSLIQPAST